MKSLTVYSGGLDSTVLVYYLQSLGMEQHLLSLNYGQKHSKELDSAKFFATLLGLPHSVLDLSVLGQLLGSCLTTDSAVPEGHYEHETMKATVVPNRNAIFLSIGYGMAVSKGFDMVSFAAHSGDHFIYPDCRPIFVEKLERAFKAGNDSRVFMNASFLDKTKQDIVALGDKLGVPFAQTWSCYKGQNLHCGKCGTCYERREAFELAKVTDATLYGQAL